MPPSNLEIPWGNDLINLSLPDHWRLAGVLEPASLPPVADPIDEVRRALAEPVNMPCLPDLVHQHLSGPDARVALVIDDGSRPTPVSAILPTVLADLERGGLRREQITLVPALGLHRPMTEEEIAARIAPSPSGREILASIHWENPDCDDPNKLVFLGTTRFGTPVWVNKAVAEADLVISIGCIEPHIIASFGGGYKNIVPGVAGRQTVAHNHTLNCTPATFNMVGQPIENNPMRQDLEEAAAMVKGKVFVVNAILNHVQQVVRVVAGDPLAAHRAGAKYSAGLYGVQVERPADVVITASHPMDSDLRQGVKALANTIRAVRPGGVVITFVRAEEGTGVFGLANRKLPLGRSALKTFSPLLLRLVPRLKLNGLGEEDRFFLYFALQAMRHALLLMYAPTIPAETQEHLPFVSFVSQPAAALDLARQRFPREASVLFFPHGGITYPVIS